jgi:hypothetical protein
LATSLDLIFLVNADSIHPNPKDIRVSIREIVAPVTLDTPQGSGQVCCNREDFIVEDYIFSDSGITPYVGKRCELWFFLERRNAQPALNLPFAVSREDFDKPDLGAAVIQGSIYSLD